MLVGLVLKANSIQQCKSSSQSFPGHLVSIQQEGLTSCLHPLPPERREVREFSGECWAAICVWGFIGENQTIVLYFNLIVINLWIDSLVGLPQRGERGRGEKWERIKRGESEEKGKAKRSRRRRKWREWERKSGEYMHCHWQALLSCALYLWWLIPRCVLNLMKLFLSQWQVVTVQSKYDPWFFSRGENRVLCFLHTFFKDFVYLFLERREGREKERERNMNVWSTLMWPPLGTQPATQVCAPTGNRISNPLVCSLH